MESLLNKRKYTNIVSYKNTVLLISTEKSQMLFNLPFKIQPFQTTTLWPALHFWNRTNTGGLALEQRDFFYIYYVKNIL